MIFDDKQREGLELVSRPLIEWLNINCHPHVKAIVDCTHIELLEGVCSIIIEDYIRD